MKWKFLPQGVQFPRWGSSGLEYGPNNLGWETGSYELRPLRGHTQNFDISGRGRRPPLVRGDPSWLESPKESRRGGKSDPRTILGPARTGLLIAAELRPGALSPELQGAEQPGERRTDEASATSVPWHPAPVGLDEVASTRGDIALSPE